MELNILLQDAKLTDLPELVEVKEIMNQVLIAEKINTISVTGNGMLLDQLKQLFVSGTEVKKE